MPARVANIVVTCTKRKSAPADESLQFGTLAASSIAELSRIWLSRLKKSIAPSRPADELYQGDHWQIARSLPDVARDQRIKVRLWVCSAGYGLIPSNAPLKPYSATFSTHHNDSVLRSLGRLKDASLPEWWARLAKWPGPVPGEPRSLAELAGASKRSPLIFVASDVYLQAVATDLEDAKASLADPRLLTIVSGSGELGETLKSNRLPCGARLQSLLGGALMSLNVRVVRRIFSRDVKWPMHCDELAKEFQELVDSQPLVVQPQRIAMSDEEVSLFIQETLGRRPEMRASPLLRELRDSGRACEQKRFGRLYREVQEQSDE